MDQWRRVAVLVGCSPGSQPAQNCEGSPAVVVFAYTTNHSNTLTDWQLIIIMIIIIIKPRAARTPERDSIGHEQELISFISRDKISSTELTDKK